MIVALMAPNLHRIDSKRIKATEVLDFYSILSNTKFLNRRLKMNGLLKFIKSEQGATAVEYGLMVALIAVVIIAAVAFVGTSTSQKYSMVGSTIGAAS